MSLLPDERRIVNACIPAEDVLAMAVARLYQASPNPNEWTYTRKMGPIVLARNQSGAQSLKLVDLAVSANY